MAADVVIRPSQARRNFFRFPIRILRKEFLVGAGRSSGALCLVPAGHASNPSRRTEPGAEKAAEGNPEGAVFEAAYRVAL